MTPPLLSPVTRSALVPAGRDLLRDSDGRLWPVLDGIPFLRAGRDALVATIVARLQDGDVDGALVAALRDQDDWWTGPVPDDDAVRRLIRDRDHLSLRDAMDHLGFGRVGHYFAHRWTDPTFLSGLALLETHWTPAASTFELACGIGHFGRELTRRGLAFTGGDVVFSKLWLARHWVLPADATLICFDAAAPWPVAHHRFDLVLCHDAFYFLEPKAEIASVLRALASPGGRVAIGHIHNSEAAVLSTGHAMLAEDVAQMFPDADTYDDAELTRALAEGRTPRSAAPDLLRHVEAFSVEDCGKMPSRTLTDGLAMPTLGAPLRLNPLYERCGDGFEIAWPSARYEAEYAALATYPRYLTDAEAERAVRRPDAEAVRRRIVVDLPERW